MRPAKKGLGEGLEDEAHERETDQRAQTHAQQGADLALAEVTLVKADAAHDKDHHRREEQGLEPERRDLGAAGGVVHEAHPHAEVHREHEEQKLHQAERDERTRDVVTKQSDHSAFPPRHGARVNRAVPPVASLLTTAAAYSIRGPHVRERRALPSCLVICLSLPSLACAPDAAHKCWSIPRTLSPQANKENTRLFA